MKKILIILAVLLIAFLAFYFTRPNSYDVERTIVIKASPEQIWPYVSNFENWNKWSAWKEKDSTVTNTFEGEQGIVGSVTEYTSLESGSGRMVNTGMTKNEEITYNMKFLEPWESESTGHVRLKKVDGGTEVSWGFGGEHNAFSKLMNMDKMIGPDFDRGLELLKEKVEKEAMENKNKYEVKTGIFEEKNFLAKKYTNLAQGDATGEFFAQNYASLSEQKAVFGNGVASAIFYSWDMELGTTDMAIVMPLVEIPKNIAKGFEIINIPESKCIYIDYYGSYADMEAAHTALNEYLINNNMGEDYIAIEEYINDPAIIPNPKDLLTRISYLKL